VSHTWGRPAAEPGEGWAVVDVETTGFRPGPARVVSVAALAVGDDGNVERSVSTLLNPGVDPGPTHVHGLTAEMLEGQPCFADVAPALIEVLRGRTLVAHNVGFDYSFLAAEAELAAVELPIDTVMCTVELARRLEGITPKMLTQTLRVLERDGLVRREIFPVIPPRVEYELTELGQNLAGLLTQIRSWSEEHVPDIKQARARAEANQEAELQAQV